MSCANAEIREMIAKNRIRNWEVAECLGVHFTTFSTWLRYELPEEKKCRIINAINQLLESR